MFRSEEEKLDRGFLRNFFHRFVKRKPVKAETTASIVTPPSPVGTSDVNESHEFEMVDDYNLCGYQFVRKLGKGDSGEVIEMTRDNQNYAVKICELKKRRPAFLKQSSHDPQEEAALLRNLNHPYVVKVYDFINDVDNRKLYIIMELLPGGTMEKLTDPIRKKKAFGQLLTAVQYLHLHRLAHRDIKLDNVMLDAQGRVRLCDFGISLVVPAGDDQIPSELKGTPAYLSPELLTCATYNPFKADIWALGVLLFMSMFGKVPFPAVNLIMQEQSIVNNLPDYPSDADPLLVDLLNKLLCKNPDQRIDLGNIWSHPWMQGVKPSLVHLMLRVKEICQIMSKVELREAIIEVHRGRKKMVASRPLQRTSSQRK